MVQRQVPVGGGEPIRGFIPINAHDDVLRLAIGLTGLAAERDRGSRHIDGLAAAVAVYPASSFRQPARDL